MIHNGTIVGVVSETESGQPVHGRLDHSVVVKGNVLTVMSPRTANPQMGMVMSPRTAE